MAFFLLRPRAVLGAMVVSIPLTASGACGSRTACFEYTQAEYSLHNDSCPAPADALAGFTSASCPGSIVSVDGPGTFDGEICCYSVTYSHVDQSCGTANGGSTDTSTGTSTVFPGNTSSSGTFCPSSCAQLLPVGLNGPQCAGPSAFGAYNALQNCAGCGGILDDGGGCLGLCPSFCAGGPIDSDCANCLPGSCGLDWNNCLSN